eukprot:CAMPEP_0117572724 /NCGR_PEP_ID=MMETSP0784-20121206/60514_1 /TAXON_ID=39447 /ORGANISM="" /LENGTH=111 /DNA_ID=CAMNT_0005371123 /DNA_START=1 /DNA_END=336 /DNA_ORIENTATION=-
MESYSPPGGSSYVHGGGHEGRGDVNGHGHEVAWSPHLVKKRRRKRRGFLEAVLHKAKQPEVLLLTVWWFTMLVLVVYMAEMGVLLRAIWRPLFLLFSIPIACFTALCIVTM